MEENSSQDSCQLYKYDRDFFMVSKDTPTYFSIEFVKNAIDADYVSWLNFHDLSDKESIERLCDHLDIDKLSVEDIYTEKRRPKLEEYPNYMFFSIRSALPSQRSNALLNQEQISFILGKDYLISFQGKVRIILRMYVIELSVNVVKFDTKVPIFYCFEC